MYIVCMYVVRIYIVRIYIICMHVICILNCINNHVYNCCDEIYRKREQQKKTIIRCNEKRE